MPTLDRTSLLTTWLTLWFAVVGLTAGDSSGSGSSSSGRPYPQQTLANTELRTVPRSSNGREYLLYVALPTSYGSETAKRYPVVYICDGYWDFTLLCGFYGNLIFDQVVPEYILVGFGYQGEKPNYDSLRAYDYTPVADRGRDPNSERTGHAAEFLAVIEKEILPFVDKEYRTDPSYRVLGGSSLGGLFALYALFTKPTLFQAYIAPSPAAVWANNWLFNYEEEFFKSGKPLPARLFMTGAAEEWPEFLRGIQRFHEQLNNRSYDGFQYEWRLIEGERHAGTKAESYNRGIRFALAPLVQPGSAK
jgi:uncharacterized protein